LSLLSNGLFRRLSQADQALLATRCKPVLLEAGQVLSSKTESSTQVYFLVNATVALAVPNTQRIGLGVALMGAEGALGLPLALGMGAGPFTWLVQSGGAAWCVDGTVLQRLVVRRRDMLMVFAVYLCEVAREVALLAGASQVGDIRARVAGWILLSHRRSGAGDLHLTHAHLAAMLGVRRASVTLAAVELKNLGLLGYQRGCIQVLSLEGLESIAGAWPVRS
jgi:CRP-like cAMP-binding protein